MATQIINKYDLNGDKKMDALEFTQALIGVDTNANGKWDTAEIMNFFDNALPAIDLGGVNDDNVNQKYGLYRYAVGIINKIAQGDKKISADEYYEFYLKKLGLPKYLATGFIKAYDKNKDGFVDALELTQKYIGLDKNKTGKLEFYETMKYYETIANAGSGSDLFNFNPNISNSTQLNNAFNAYTGFVKSNDLNGDQKMQANEYEQALLRARIPNADVLAANAISLYDKNHDGGLDTFEWMDAVLKFDLNGNGLLDGAEVANFYKSIGG